MVRKLLMGVGAFICFLLQACVFPKFNLGGIVPNLCLLITCIFGFMNGEKYGMITGFSLGLLIDVFFGNFIGLNALLFLYIGFLNGKFYGIYYPEDIKLPLGLILTSNFSYGILCYVSMFLLRARFHIGFYISHIILPEVLYSMLAAIVVYPLVLIIHLAFDKYEHKKEVSDV